MPKIFPNNIVKNTLELLQQHKSPHKFWTELLSRIHRHISCVPNLILPLVYLSEVHVSCDALISTWVRKGERGDMSWVRTIKGAAVKMKCFPHSFSMTVPTFLQPASKTAAEIETSSTFWSLATATSLWSYTNTANYTTQCHAMRPVMLIAWHDSNVMLYTQYCNQWDPSNAGN